MKSLSSIGLGLSVVFTCLLLFLFGEIYYLLWWKRRIIRREIMDGYKSSNPTREFLFLICWKNKNLPTLVNPTTNTPQTNQTHPYQDFQLHTNNENIETQLVIGQQPRFLFPIEEETKEDLLLESQDGKTREGKKCLSDLLKRIETPYMTPISSPLTTPMMSMSNNSTISGFNPFNEEASDAEFNKFIKCSPPPKFKFLRDADEKLLKKIMIMEGSVEDNNEAIMHKDKRQKQVEEDGSFITIIVGKNKEFDGTHHHYHHSPSTSSSIIT